MKLLGFDENGALGRMMHGAKLKCRCVCGLTPSIRAVCPVPIEENATVSLTKVFKYI